MTLFEAGMGCTLASLPDTSCCSHFFPSLFYFRSKEAFVKDVESSENL